MSNIALNGYSNLDDLAYFGHKDFEDFCSTNIRQDLNCGGTNNRYKVIKHFQGMVWRASEIKRLKQPLLVDTNITRDEANEWYLEAVVEVGKLKKEFDIDSPGKFVYAEWCKWEKQLIIPSIQISTLEEFPWRNSSGRMMRL